LLLKVKLILLISGLQVDALSFLVSHVLVTVGKVVLLHLQMVSLVLKSLVEISDFSVQRGDGVNARLFGFLDVLVILLIGGLTLVLGGLLDVPRSVEVLKKVIEDSDDGGDHTLVSLDWGSFDHFLDKDQNGVEMSSRSVTRWLELTENFVDTGISAGLHLKEVGVLSVVLLTFSGGQAFFHDHFALHDDVSDHFVLHSGGFEFLTFVLTVSSKLLNKVINILKLFLSTDNFFLSISKNFLVNLDEIFVFLDIKDGSLNESFQVFSGLMALVHFPEIGVRSGLFLSLNIRFHAFEHVDDGMDTLSHLDLQVDRIGHNLLVLTILSKSLDK